MREFFSTLSCLGCGLLFVIFNMLAGGWSVSYLLVTLLDKHIPFIYSFLIGLITGEFSVPFAIVVWLLKAAKVL